MQKKAVQAAVVALLAHSAVQGAPLATGSSPDGSITVNVELDGDGRAHYSVSRKGKLLIAPSKLGFILTDSYDMVRGFKFDSAETKPTVDEKWEQPWGERRFVRNHYNDLIVRFRQPTYLKRAMNVRFRIFDNGVGFRYEIPEQDNLKTMKIADEITEFSVASPGTAWWITGGEWNRYEQIYQKTPIDAVSTAHTPITMKLDDGTHLSFHEAALVDYSAFWFKRGEKQTFRTMLSPSSQGPRVIRDTPFATPWRAIRIGDSAASLVENDLELNLNEPNKLGDVSWFRPQKYVGIWWGMISGIILYPT